MNCKTAIVLRQVIRKQRARHEQEGARRGHQAGEHGQHRLLLHHHEERSVAEEAPAPEIRSRGAAARALQGAPISRRISLAHAMRGASCTLGPFSRLLQEEKISKRKR